MNRLKLPKPHRDVIETGLCVATFAVGAAIAASNLAPDMTEQVIGSEAVASIHEAQGGPDPLAVVLGLGMMTVAAHTIARSSKVPPPTPKLPIFITPQLLRMGTQSDVMPQGYAMRVRRQPGTGVYPVTTLAHNRKVFVGRRIDSRPIVEGTIVP